MALCEFVGLHLERAPLMVARGQAGRFDHVLSLAKAERLACCGSLRTPAVRVVSGGRQLPFGEFSEEAAHAGGLSGVVRVERVAAEFAGGATIALQWLQRHWPPAARYCRGLELAFGFPAWANAYWTQTGRREVIGLDVGEIESEAFWREFLRSLEPRSTVSSLRVCPVAEVK